MMLARQQDWPSRLSGFLKQARHRPFVWGVHDCALMACDWVLEATGVDPAAPLRGSYASAEGAVLACRHFSDGGGLAEVAAMIAAELGQPEIPPAFAQRGDLLYALRPEGPALGICIGENGAFATAPAGWARLATRLCARAWRV